MKINKVKDWLERTFWTFANTFMGLLIADNLLGSINLGLAHKLEGAALAAALTTIKVIVAQRVGSNNDGAAIPGGITKGAR